MAAEIQDKKRKECLSARCDIFRERDKVVLLLEMPGVNQDRLDIKVDGDKLIIHGSKKLAYQEGEYRLNEIRNGHFHHEFVIDDTINRENIDASIKNGLVNIVLSLKESEKPRTIKIQAK